MSKADDVFIRQFIIILVLLAAYGVGAAVLGIWIAGSARDAAAGSERGTLERIAPAGQLKLGEPGQGGERAEAAESGSESAAEATSSPPESPAPDAGDRAAPPAVAAVAAPSGGATGNAATATTTPVPVIGEMEERIYKQYCFACHLTGVAEAPKTGDAEAWAPLAATGFDALYKNVINGKGTMPPRAGFMHLSDEELKAGIRYLLAAANLTAE